MSANKSLAREAYEAAQDAYDRVVASAYRACDELIDARDDYRNHVSRLSAQRYEQALTHYKIAVAEVKRAGDEVERMPIRSGPPREPGSPRASRGPYPSVGICAGAAS